MLPKGNLTLRPIPTGDDELRRAVHTQVIHCRITRSEVEFAHPFPWIADPKCPVHSW